jgi:hypothetical protein
MMNSLRGLCAVGAVLVALPGTQQLYAKLDVCSFDKTQLARGLTALRAGVPIDGARRIGTGAAGREGVWFCVQVLISPAPIPSPNFRRLVDIVNNGRSMRLTISDSRPLCTLLFDTTHAQLVPFSPNYVDSDALGQTLVPPTTHLEPDTLYACSPDVEIFVFWDRPDLDITFAHELVHGSRFMAGMVFQHCGGAPVPGCNEVDRQIRESYDEVRGYSTSMGVSIGTPADFLIYMRGAQAVMMDALRHSREMTLLCSPKVIQPPRSAGVGCARSGLAGTPLRLPGSSVTRLWRG